MPRFIFASLFILISCASAGETLVFSTGVDTAEQGLSVQVVKEAYQQIGLKVDVQHYPNMRSLMKSNNGEVDGELARISHINQRFKNLLQVPIVINYIDGYAFSAHKNLQVVDWASLREYKLVCIRGLLFVEQNLSHRNMPCYQVTTYLQALNLLKIQRYDVAVLPELTGFNVLRKNQLTGVSIVGERLIRVDLYHYLHKKNQAILPKITAVLQEMKTSGRLEEIRAEYIMKQGFSPISIEN